MKLLLGIVFVAGAIALVYAGVLTGEADAKVRRLMIALVVVIGLAVAGLWLRSGLEEPNDGPRMCGAMRC